MTITNILLMALVIGIAIFVVYYYIKKKKEEIEVKNMLKV